MNFGETISAVKSNRVLLDDEVLPAVIVIKNGKIHKIIPHGDFSADAGLKVKSFIFIYFR